jgi:RNA-binding protein
LLLRLHRSIGENPLKKLGKVLHTSPATGNIIVKSQCETKVGQKVFDNGLRQVGAVFDIFGPVSSPYIAVKPYIKDSEKMVNQIVYLVEEGKRKK